MQESLPALATMFGWQQHRVRGIEHWADLIYLGKTNLTRLQQLAQETVLALMAAPHDSDDLRAIKRGIDFIADLAVYEAKKPLLPRLRVESFQLHDRVMIYLKDTPNYLGKRAWQLATITNISKAHKSDWVDGKANSGYYWRVTASADQPIFSNANTIDFSTSEPRVLLEWEYNYLKQIRKETQFLTIFAANAWRNWSPIWCLERHLTVDAAQMDFRAWLAED